MAARKTPDNVLSLRGTIAKNKASKRIEGYQPPAEGYPKPPAYLDDAALAVWAEVEAIMGGCNLYCQADAAKLARYCCLEAQFRADPAEYQAAKLTQLRLMERDLFLDAESRSKISGSDQVKRNPFADLCS